MMIDKNRNKELAKIHIGAKAIGLDVQDKSPESDYRAMLLDVAGVRSSADLDREGRRKVLDHLRACGARFRQSRRPTPAMDKDPLIRKVRALLINHNPPRADTYADGIAHRMFHVERFEWCTPEQLRSIIAALNYDAERNG